MAGARQDETPPGTLELQRRSRAFIRNTSAVQWLYAIAATALIVGGGTIFIAFLGTASGIVLGSALIVLGAAFVIYAVF